MLSELGDTMAHNSNRANVSIIATHQNHRVDYPWLNDDEKYILSNITGSREKEIEEIMGSCCWKKKKSTCYHLVIE